MFTVIMCEQLLDHEKYHVQMFRFRFTLQMYLGIKSGLNFVGQFRIEPYFSRYRAF